MHQNNAQNSRKSMSPKKGLPSHQTQNSPQQTQQAPMAAQATQQLLKKQLYFTPDQLVELNRAGRFGKVPVPPEYAVIPPQEQRFAGRKTLVLDLDETLIHSKFSLAHVQACRTRGKCDFQMRIVVEGRPIQVYVLIRPGVLFFLQKLAQVYEIVLYTASMNIYANPLVDTLDQDGLIPMRLYREHCFSFQGSYIKDLSLIGRPMKDVIIVDNSPNAYFFHPENAVPILSWYDDPDDRCLFEMIPLLEALSHVDDVRSVIPKFVRKDVALVDFPKAAYILNDAYRQMQVARGEQIQQQDSDQNQVDQQKSAHQQKQEESQLSENQSPTGSYEQNTPQKSGKKQKDSPKKMQQNSNNSPPKPSQTSKIDEAYERKPSPINLKPISQTKQQMVVQNKSTKQQRGVTAGVYQISSAEVTRDQPAPSATNNSNNQAVGSQEGRKILQNQQATALSPRTARITSKQMQSSAGDMQEKHANSNSNSESDKTQMNGPLHNNSNSNSLSTNQIMSRRNGRGRSQQHQQQEQVLVSGERGANQNQVAQIYEGEEEEDEVASDAVDAKRHQRRKKSHQMKPDDSGDFEINHPTTTSSKGVLNSHQQRVTVHQGQQYAANDSNHQAAVTQGGGVHSAQQAKVLYQKVNERKQIFQRSLAANNASSSSSRGGAGEGGQANYSRKVGVGSEIIANGNQNGEMSPADQMNHQNGKGSFSQNTMRKGAPLEISTNKADMIDNQQIKMQQTTKNSSYTQNVNNNGGGVSSALVDLPPHIQKIMQARSTTNKTSSMARNQKGLLSPTTTKHAPHAKHQANHNQHHIQTVHTQQLSGRLGTGQKQSSNGNESGAGKSKVAPHLTQTFQNIPKSNTLFQGDELIQNSGHHGLMQAGATSTDQDEMARKSNGRIPVHQTVSQSAKDNLSRSLSNNQVMSNKGSGVGVGAAQTSTDQQQAIGGVGGGMITAHQQNMWARTNQTKNANGNSLVGHHGQGQVNSRRKMSRNEIAANDGAVNHQMNVGIVGAHSAQGVGVGGLGAASNHLGGLTPTGGQQYHHQKAGTHTNLSIRRGIQRYTQGNSHNHNHQNGSSGGAPSNSLQRYNQHAEILQSSSNNVNVNNGTGQSVKLIGKNSLHMKRRSEYPSSARQWHLPSQSAQNGLMTSDSQPAGIISASSPKGASSGNKGVSQQQMTAQSFSYTGGKHAQKHAQISAAWKQSTNSHSKQGQISTTDTGTGHSQSQTAGVVNVKNASANQKSAAEVGGNSSGTTSKQRVQNQSVGQLASVKQINSASIPAGPPLSGHKKVQSLLTTTTHQNNTNTQGTALASTSGEIRHNRSNPRGINIMQPSIGNTGLSYHMSPTMVPSQSSSTRHRKPPMLIRQAQSQSRGGVLVTHHHQGVGGERKFLAQQQPMTTQNRTGNGGRIREHWLQYSNTMGSPTTSQSPAQGVGGASIPINAHSNINAIANQAGKVAENGDQKSHKSHANQHPQLVIASSNAAASGSHGNNSTGPTYLNLIQQTQQSQQQQVIQQSPALNQHQHKPKLKTSKQTGVGVSSQRGRSVPQERPSASQGNQFHLRDASNPGHNAQSNHLAAFSNGKLVLQQKAHPTTAGASMKQHSSGGGGSAASGPTNHNFRGGSTNQRQQFISSSNKAIKTIKTYTVSSSSNNNNQVSGANQQRHN